MHQQHACGLEAVYEVEEDLIDVHENHDSTETKSKSTSEKLASRFCDRNKNQQVYSQGGFTIMHSEGINKEAVDG